MVLKLQINYLGNWKVFKSPKFGHYITLLCQQQSKNKMIVDELKTITFWTLEISRLFPVLLATVGKHQE
jgi:hypothetical protein